MHYIEHLAGFPQNFAHKVEQSLGTIDANFHLNPSLFTKKFDNLAKCNEFKGIFKTRDIRLNCSKTLENLYGF